MNLLTALSQFNDVTNPATPSNVRSEIASVVFAALEKSSFQAVHHRDEREDICQEAFLRLVKCERRFVFDEERVAYAYLNRLLRNTTIDLCDRKPHAKWCLLPMQPEQGDDGTQLSLENLLAARPGTWQESMMGSSRFDEVAQEANALFHALLDACCQCLKQQRSRDGFLQSVREMIELADGDDTIEALMERTGRKRNAIYKAHERARTLLQERFVGLGEWWPAELPCPSGEAERWVQLQLEALKRRVS